MKRIRNCGGPSLGMQAWLARPGPFGDLAAHWPQLRDRRVIGTFRGRSAIALACRLLGIGPGDHVLMPAYNCGTEIDALLHAGARCIGYPVSRQCDIHLDELQARRTNRTRAVYVIHYFGWEQPMVALRQWCDKEGLLLVEDCALALFSAGPSGTIGRMGDASIYSLPKSLGCCHGGLLSLAVEPKVPVPPLAPAGRLAWFNELRHSAQGMVLGGLDRVGLYGPVIRARRRCTRRPPRAGEADDRPPMPADYYFDPALHADRAMHPQMRAAASGVAHEEVIRRRRSNYMQLAASVSRVPGVTLLFPDLAPGVCPLSLPLLFSHRDACVAALQRRGIDAFPWWAGFHRDGMDWSQFPDACWLKNHLLTLPVHQGLDERDLAYVADTFAEVAPVSP